MVCLTKYIFISDVHIQKYIGREISLIQTAHIFERIFLMFEINFKLDH